MRRLHRLARRRPIRSCQLPVGSVGQRKILTIESLAQNGPLHPLQEAFLKHDAFQCGYCTGGMIMSALGLLQKSQDPLRAGNPPLHERQRLPLRRLSAHCRRHPRGRQDDDGRCKMIDHDVFNAGVRSASSCSSRPATASLWTAANSSRPWAAAWSCSPWPARPWPRNPALPGRRGGRGGQVPADINAWLHIGEDGVVTVFTGKAEVGQNIRTSLTQAVAEELRAPVASIKLVMADTHLTPFDMGTFGSMTTPQMASRLHQNRRRRPRGPARSGRRPFQSRPRFPRLADGKISKPAPQMTPSPSAS